MLQRKRTPRAERAEGAERAERVGGTHRPTRPRPFEAPDAPDRPAAARAARALALVGALFALAAAGAPPAWALEEEHWSTRLPATGFDLAVLRPLGAFRLLAGAALWVPVTAMWPPLYRENYRQFVRDPFDYLILRELGRDYADS